MNKIVEFTKQEKEKIQAMRNELQDWFDNQKAFDEYDHIAAYSAFLAAFQIMARKLDIPDFRNDYSEDLFEEKTACHYCGTLKKTSQLSGKNENKIISFICKDCLRNQRKKEVQND